MNLKQRLKQKRDLRHKKRRDIRQKSNWSSAERTVRVQLMYNLKRLAVKEQLEHHREKNLKQLRLI